MLVKYYIMHPPGGGWVGGGVTAVKNLQFTNCSPTSDCSQPPPLESEVGLQRQKQNCCTWRSLCREISMHSTGLPLVYLTIRPEMGAHILHNSVSKGREHYKSKSLFDISP